MEKYNQELLARSQEENNIIYAKNNVMDNITKIYIPNKDLILLSRVITLDDIRPLLPFSNVEKTDYGFNIILSMENHNFVIITDYDGNVEYMFFYANQLYEMQTFSKINVGMSISEVESFFPLLFCMKKPLLF